ncbi:hypothetical protein [Massilia genomosp. 1]|uniref:DUF2169 domain-containing protein n=1 Tax=Massilia genomosp. 1 TaxID=2609280 RepID=A0ABX0MGI4_9BURK|nr:hypothetical protein [Massilia genomosp. 1]NHZ61906.1 hypothetical protein [Massilia genomosp. 1]
MLKRSYLNKRGEFIGVFELRNDAISPALAVPGERRGGRFMVGPPDTWIDFQDVNGRWDMLLFGAISHYLPRPHALSVKQGRAVQFDAYLFPRDLVRKDGAAFTLTLYSSAPRHCVVSLPFTAVRAPRPVTRLVSDPVPPMVGWIEETDVKTKQK